jgi:Flp pilus assembly protein TadD
MVTCKRRLYSNAVILVVAGSVGGCATSPDMAPVRSPADQPGASTAEVQIPSLMRVGASTAAAGDYATAIGFFRRAHGLDPQRLAPLLALGKVLSAAGAHNEALNAYRRALKLSPDDRTALKGIGNSLIALRQPEAAISHFEGALAAREDTSSYNGMGVAYDMMGKYREAQAFYRAGLDLEPKNLSLRNNLGLSLALSGRYDEAVPVLRAVAAAPGATKRYRLNLALAYGLAGEMEEARKIARIDLDEASVRENIAYYRTLRALKDSRAAVEAVGAYSTGQFALPAPSTVPAAVK